MRLSSDLSRRGMGWGLCSRLVADVRAGRSWTRKRPQQEAAAAAGYGQSRQQPECVTNVQKFRKYTSQKKICYDNILKL